MLKPALILERLLLLLFSLIITTTTDFFFVHDKDASVLVMAIDVTITGVSCNQNLPIRLPEGDGIQMACAEDGTARCSFGEEVTLAGTCEYASFLCEQHNYSSSFFLFFFLLFFLWNQACRRDRERERQIYRYTDR